MAKRWGEEVQIGTRVRLSNRYETPPRVREGTIVGKSWGRDRGKPIYWFSVEFDDLDGQWVFGPGEVGAPPRNA